MKDYFDRSKEKEEIAKSDTQLNKEILLFISAGTIKYNMIKSQSHFT